MTSAHTMVRTRFAPSPTGLMHLGGLRTALYSFLIAKQLEGEFLLRIDDTDRERYVEGAVDGIIDILTTFHLAFDQRPIVQSERIETYKAAAAQLLDSDNAYTCFCTTEELDRMRTEQTATGKAPRYDRRCRYLSDEERAAKTNAGTAFVVRLKIPESGGVTIKDHIRGKVSFSYSEVDDQVIIKSDGYPTYHLANVVDDHDLQITHVIRGEEWLSSTPKHLFMYHAFGWDNHIPAFAHLPLILNTKRKKLSKRDGDISVRRFLDEGYLTDALVNVVALLGWNPKTTQEFFTLDELVKSFSLKGLHKAPAVFDHKRLDWFNAHYIKKMPISEFTSIAIPYLQQKDITTTSFTESQLQAAMKLEQSRVSRLKDVGEETSFYFQHTLDYDATLLPWKTSSPDSTRRILDEVKSLLQDVSDEEFAVAHLEKKLFEYIANASLGNGDVLWPLRVALTGQKNSPGPFECAELLGRERSLERIRIAIEKLS
jgi:glutamyl-tRNA synthetase